MEVLRLLRGTCFHLEYDLLADCISKRVCDSAYEEGWKLEDLDRHIANHIANHKRWTQPVQGGVERWKGPKQRQLLKLLEDTKPRKCLVMVGDNAEQLVLTLLLRACGINARSYHSALLTEQHQALARDFRHPDHPTRVVITSPRMGSTGINLQGAATIAYCMSIPFHCAASDQAFARIIRIGQKHYVHCIFDVLQPSFDTSWGQPRRRGKAGEDNMAGMASSFGLLDDEVDLDEIGNSAVSKRGSPEMWATLDEWHRKAMRDKEGWRQGFGKSFDPAGLRGKAREQCKVHKRRAWKLERCGVA